MTGSRSGLAGALCVADEMTSLLALLLHYAASVAIASTTAVRIPIVCEVLELSTDLVV